MGEVRYVGVGYGRTVVAQRTRSGGLAQQVMVLSVAITQAWEMPEIRAFQAPAGASVWPQTPTNPDPNEHWLMVVADTMRPLKVGGRFSGYVG